MPRPLAIVALFVVSAALGVGLALAPARERETPREDPLLRSGEMRYAAYLEAEAASLRAARLRRDSIAVRLHEGRVAPAGGRLRADPVAAANEAARLLSLDARHAGSRALLGVEARVAGAAVAFDAIRDALWARDKGLTGSIDERLAGLRTELDRHRRGNAFRRASSLTTADRRRLGAALDAYAWRLSLAARRVGG